MRRHPRTSPLGSAMWPSDDPRLRVLVEGDASAAPDLDGEFYQLAVCSGPSERPHRSCPLVESGSCSLLEAADVVVNALPLEQMCSREVLRAVHRRLPAKPAVRVGLSKADVLRFHPALQGWHVVPETRDQGDVSRAVREELGARGRRSFVPEHRDDRPWQRTAGVGMVEQ